MIDCHVVRDKDSGVSRGFAFLTFLDESEADTAIEYQNHLLDGKPIRVSLAQRNAAASGFNHGNKTNLSNVMDSVSIPRYQVRVYLGPLDNDVTNGDITSQLGQYGPIKGNY